MHQENQNMEEEKRGMSMQLGIDVKDIWIIR